MQISTKSWLLVSLIVVAFAVLFSNLLSEEISIIVGNLLYPPVTSVFVVLAVWIAIKNRLRGSMGKAWALFAAVAIFWTVAENLWVVYELILEIDPWPSEADLFWFMGYPLYFGFLIYYLRPFRSSITKKNIIISGLFSSSLIVPSIFIAYDQVAGNELNEVVIALLYPIADSIVLAPSIIGISLFFKGKVNFLWSAMCFGIILDIIADTSFLFLALEDVYYSGHPIEILYLWSYVLFTFGIYQNKKIFNVKIKKQSY